jgi:hypothetical protein
MTHRTCVSPCSYVRCYVQLVLLSPVLPVDRHRRCLTKPLARATLCASAMGPRVLLSG